MFCLYRNKINNSTEQCKIFNMPNISASSPMFSLPNMHSQLLSHSPLHGYGKVHFNIHWVREWEFIVCWQICNFWAKKHGHNNSWENLGRSYGCTLFKGNKFQCTHVWQCDIKLNENFLMKSAFDLEFTYEHLDVVALLNVLDIIKSLFYVRL